MNKLIKCVYCGRFGSDNDMWTYKKKRFLFPVTRDFEGWLKVNKLVDYYEGKCYQCEKERRYKHCGDYAES